MIATPRLHAFVTGPWCAAFGLLLLVIDLCSGDWGAASRDASFVAFGLALAFVAAQEVDGEIR